MKLVHMTRGSGAPSESNAVTSVSVAVVVARRLKELRRQRGHTAQQFVDRCAELGGPRLSTFVLANIETGRREASVSELLGFALALGVPPAALLTPGPDDTFAVRIAEQAVVNDREALDAWVRGRAPLPGYEGTAQDGFTGLNEGAAATTPDARAGLQAALGRLVVQFDQEMTAFAERTRDQYSAALAEAAERVADGATPAEVVAALEGFRHRVGATNP
ncbi:helix-turn-helix domain-containing protein [Cryptosporangium sp. NPDC051539]|uniref:helix-turn-helix domain-containing protein n=1 Tax=Cryptosporangium sp. NPDC051539 TaxID=3363962 RepID=UPI0037A92612